MPSLCEVMDAIKPGMWFWKGDLLDGYKQFFVQAQARRFFGMRVKDLVFLDATLPFGWNGAPGWFSAFSYAIRDWMLGNGDALFTFIDDFLGMADTQVECLGSLDRWLTLLLALGLADKEKKRRLPAQIMEFLGFVWDSLAMEVRLPEAKKKKLLTLLQSFVGRGWASLADVQQLAGKLGFAAQVVRGGWTHIRRIWDTYKGCGDLPSYQRIKLSKGFINDVEFWLKYLPVWNGISTLRKATAVRIRTDACKFGYGAAWGVEWMAGAWSLATRKKRHSNWKELSCVLLAAREWGDQWQDAVVEVEMDNAVSVGIINKGYSPVRKYMRLARKLFWLAVEKKFEIRAVWIAGVLNERADALSRWLTDLSIHRAGQGDPIPR